MTRKNRYMLCLLLAGVLLYYAVPRLNLYSGGAEGVFTIAWLLFALVVIAGNLTAMLYAPHQRARKSKRIAQRSLKKRVRSYD